MKQFRILAALLLSLFGGSAMAQQYMVVNLEDGSKVEYRLTDVKEVTFREADEEPATEMQWVDLGLPSGLLWAAYNLGADAPEAYGDYYIWGDTEPYNENTPSKSLKGVSASTLEAQGIIENNTLTPEYDAASVVLGGGSRMPTAEDIRELRDNTTWAWETLNGVRGMRFTSETNGNSVFFPAAGLVAGDVVNGVLPKVFETELVAFNTSTTSGTLIYDLYIFVPEKDSYGYNNGNFPNSTTFRDHGRVVRAVKMPLQDL